MDIRADESASASSVSGRQWVGLAVLAVCVALFVAASARWQHQFDLRIYHGAVRSWAHGGDLYAYRQPETVRVFGFTYPPFAAIAMLPMTIVAWPVAAVALALTSVSGTLLLLWRRFHRWAPTLAGVILLAAAEPWRDTLSLGQINLVLLTLVAVDLLYLVGRHPAAGILIGVAAGIKLTPAVFIAYLLLARRYRAGFIAAGTALATVGLGWLIAPGASRAYWTSLVWRTGRVGEIFSVPNQSLDGALTRMHAPAAVWPALVVVILAVWAYRVRRAAAADDAWAGLALTGVAMCLISPISWVHHLVWQIPALLVLVDRQADRRHRHWYLLLGAGIYGLMATRVLWLFKDPANPLYLPGANMHVITGLVLLLTVPVKSAPRPTTVLPAPATRPSLAKTA
ncbi:glycosyltransferase 87 family protein [Dactylosporangium darangshiense]|uniref:glycosyltransferase 87 family protein n=1 Tax=Dactylosporangium darangshiense TaxID=579108 RepID=UPI0031EC9D2A